MNFVLLKVRRGAAAMFELQVVKYINIFSNSRASQLNYGTNNGRHRESSASSKEKGKILKISPNRT